MELVGTAIVLIVLAVAFGLMKWGQTEDQGQKGQGQKGQGQERRGQERRGQERRGPGAPGEDQPVMATPYRTNSSLGRSFERNTDRYRSQFQGGVLYCLLPAREGWDARTAAPSPPAG